MKRLFAIFFCLIALVAPVLAQDDDKGYLTRLLQDNLSGAGRDVQIEGLTGSLSSQARIAKITIADSDGIWLELGDIVLEWNRSALLLGRVDVKQLTAATLNMPRLPVSEAGSGVPSPEATPFKLPELPVSIDIENLALEKITLGAPVLGTDLELKTQAAIRLGGGSGTAKVVATRLSGTRGTFRIDAGFDNATNNILLDLDLKEDTGGLISGLLNLPQNPSLSLILNGEGTLDDFNADLQLATDDTERLAGNITLLAQVDAETPGREIKADIAGDITALFAPQYRDFFGEDVALRFDAIRADSGALDIAAMDLVTQKARLTGSARLNAKNWPTFIDIEGRIADTLGGPVLLPAAGVETYIDAADLNVKFDAAQSDSWSAEFDVTKLNRSDISIARTNLTAIGTLTPSNGGLGQVNADITAQVDGIGGLQDAVAQAVGDAINLTTRVEYAKQSPLQISQLVLQGADYALRGEAVIDTLSTGFETDLQTALVAQDLSRFSAISGQALDGAADVNISGQIAPLAGRFDLAIKGTGTELRVGQAQADAVLQGVTQLDIKAARDETGTRLDRLNIVNPNIELNADANLRTDAAVVNYDATLRETSLIAEGVTGPLSAKGRATQTGAIWNVDTTARLIAGDTTVVTGQAVIDTASADLDTQVDLVVDAKNLSRFSKLAARELGGAARVNVTGTVAAKSQDFDLTVAGETVNLRTGIDQANAILRGTTTLDSKAVRSGETLSLERLSVENANLRLAANGELRADQAAVQYDVNIRDASVLSSAVTGSLVSNGRATMADDVWSVDASARGPFGASADVSGIATGPRTNLAIAARIPNVNVFVPELRGPLALDGTLRKPGAAYQIDATASGVSGTRARINGTISDTGRPNINVAGTVPLGLAAPFIRPRSIQGQAAFDLMLNGGFGLPNLSGQISTNAARLSAPTLQIALENIATTVRLANSRANIEATGAVSSGGGVQASGTVDLTGRMLADLKIALNSVTLVDPALYKTTVSGGLALRGPLTGGAQISGDLAIGETVVNVPSSGFSSLSDIPNITHIRPPQSVVRSQKRAGLLRQDESATATSSSSAGGFGLNINISAPSRIFVRGRGLDAELGGQLRLSGTTNNIISAGRFTLVRGRLSILQQRFDLDEGSIVMQGDLVPYIRFVATTETSSGTASVVIDGPADDPTISFESSPEAPQDEVLAQIILGRDLSQISAFQALQLANAVAVLAGRQDNGIITKLRSGFGLDDLDLSTDSTGNTSVRAGKYISEKVYTDVTVGSQGDSEISINIDLTPNVTAKGSTASDGNTGIGIFFEKDY